MAFNYFGSIFIIPPYAGKDQVLLVQCCENQTQPTAWQVSVITIMPLLNWELFSPIPIRYFYEAKIVIKDHFFIFSKKGLAKKRAERRPELIYFCQRAISHSRHVCICLLFQLGKRGEWKFCWFKIKDRKRSKRLKLKEKKVSARFGFKTVSFLC